MACMLDLMELGAKPEISMTGFPDTSRTVVSGGIIHPERKRSGKIKKKKNKVDGGPGLPVAPTTRTSSAYRKGFNPTHP